MEFLIGLNNKNPESDIQENAEIREKKEQAIATPYLLSFSGDQRVSSRFFLLISFLYPAISIPVSVQPSHFLFVCTNLYTSVVS